MRPTHLLYAYGGGLLANLGVWQIQHGRNPPCIGGHEAAAAAVYSRRRFRKEQKTIDLPSGTSHLTHMIPGPVPPEEQQQPAVRPTAVREAVAGVEMVTAATAFGVGTWNI